MKKNITLFLLLASLGRLWALDASIEFANFRAGKQTYVEMYLHIAGSTATFVSDTTRLGHSALDILLLFKQGEKIVSFDKYRLISPGSKLPLDFIDQRRYGLAEGQYQIELSITDSYDSTNVVRWNRDFTVPSPPTTGVQLSDIQLLKRYEPDTAQSYFTKNGYFLEALSHHFCDKMLSHLPFYFEIYNHAPGTSTEFFVTYAIEKSDGLGNVQTITKAHKKRKAAELVPVLTQLDVSKLESGNYNLMVEVRNSANELLDQKRVFFQRSNPYLNINSDSLSTDELATEFVSKLDSFTLSYSLRAIMYRVPATDVPILNGLIASGNSEAQRRFLFSYWAGSTPNFAEATYNKYMEIANALDNMYRNGFGYGFETDRGRIYIKYGRPDDIHSVENEPSAPPYEIWTYNVIESTKQKNVKFIFYNPSLVSNGHVLLHSNCRGETNNPRWKVELYRDDPNSWEGKNAFDAIDIQDNINRQGTRLFNDQ